MTGDGWKLGLTVAGVAGLAGCGFTLSFASLRDLAVASGILPELAFLWPLVVDGFIVVATAAAFRLKTKGARVTWYPWAALIAFAAVSVAGNALHAADSNTRTVAVWVATVVSAVPAVALLVASHLLAVMAEHGRHTPAPLPNTVAVPADQQADPIDGGVLHAEATVPLGELEATTDAAPAVHEAPRPVPATSPADAFMSWLEERIAAGVNVTGRMVADQFGISDRTARRRLNEARAARPDLFQGATL